MKLNISEILGNRQKDAKVDSGMQPAANPETQEERFDETAQRVWEFATQRMREVDLALAQKFGATKGSIESAQRYLEALQRVNENKDSQEPDVRDFFEVPIRPYVSSHGEQVLLRAEGARHALLLLEIGSNDPSSHYPPKQTPITLYYAGQGRSHFFEFDLRSVKQHGLYGSIRVKKGERVKYGSLQTEEAWMLGSANEALILTRSRGNDPSMRVTYANLASDGVVNLDSFSLNCKFLRSRAFYGRLDPEGRIVTEDEAFLEAHNIGVQLNPDGTRLVYHIHNQPQIEVPIRPNLFDFLPKPETLTQIGN